MSGRRLIVRSRAVYTGKKSRPVPAAIAVEGKQICGILPWDCEKQYRDWEIHDYGDRMVMPSFIDAHTHLFSGAVSASEYVCTDLGRGKSQEVWKLSGLLPGNIRIIPESGERDGLWETGRRIGFRTEGFWIRPSQTVRCICSARTPTACG